MELKHNFTVPAPVQASWDHFMDIASVAECFPGATVTGVSEEEFSGTVKVKLGPIALQYAGSGTFVERDDDAHTATIRANGKDRRGNGTAGATVTIALAPDGDGTAVDVTTDLAVTGKPAQFGRGVMQDVSDKLLGQFVACLEQRLTAAPAAASGAEADDTSASSPGEVSDASGAPAAAEVAGASGTTPAPSARSAPSHAAPPPAADDALDLGAAVVPVLLRSYAPHLVAALVGFVLGVLVGRRRR
ncbi:conserved hypothetical protein [Nostocoides japonicum T1-X7]|uniref:Carbon monoxide dehydrogenase subunit G n=1 Tax=Nostocoides japonicum T1-X7 TaxID=1194083 RepID=A0A077LW66_9MICO|nr:SRPBCC family protein [Tetrasphaera japonica]CCH77971.1 conserved hypothetical protein [Tetrasphaera japonica T1-X7]